jgi:hypothetical protein
MGMDLYGVAPTAEAGEYFRANVWHWRPLANYIENCHADLAQRCERWHTNDGDGLDADDAAELGKRLHDDIGSGRAAIYKERYDFFVSHLPREGCECCGGTGVRTDEIGVKHGMPERALDEAVAIALGRSHGSCNGCGGEGSRVAWMANYPFDLSFLAELADFLIDCGGFEIR